jgi:hypothetical protein
MGGGGGEGWDRSQATYFANGIVQARTVLHLSYRLSIRFGQFFAVSGAAAPGTGLWRAALPAFVAYDVAGWLVLRRDNRFWFRWRLALDTVDAVFWCLSPWPAAGSYDGAVFVAAPLGVEAGFRRGWKGLLVPAVVGPAVLAARLLAGGPAYPLTTAWLFLAVAMGSALYTYCRKLDMLAADERSLRRAADSRRAFLAGQNSVAMGASSAVDLLEGLVPILGRPEPGSAMWQLADGWKARLGAATRREAEYLQDALLEWERDHNRHPDLSSRAELALEEGAGTTMLTGPQVTALRRMLDGLALRGSVPVSVAGSQPTLRPPGRPLRLRVGAVGVTVPADEVVEQQPVDVGLVVYLLIPAFATNAGLTGQVPWWTVLVSAVLCLGAGWWSHQRLVALGTAARPTILRCGVLVGLILTAMFNLRVLTLHTTEGDSTLFAAGLVILAFIGGQYSHMGMRMLSETLVGAGLTTAVAVIAFPGPVGLRSLVLALVWTLGCYYPSMRHMGHAIARGVASHQRAAVAADELFALDAFRDGQREVVSLVRQAHDDARRQLVARIDGVPPTILQTLAAARLAEVERRLGAVAERR